jgi:uncharacterized protein YjdB
MAAATVTPSSALDTTGANPILTYWIGAGEVAPIITFNKTISSIDQAYYSNINANGTVTDSGQSTSADVTGEAIVRFTDGTFYTVYISRKKRVYITAINNTLSNSITLNNTGRLTATYSPAGDYTYKWTSSNSSIINIDYYSGNYTATGLGTATITCTADQGGKTLTYDITVSAPIAVTSISTISFTGSTPVRTTSTGLSVSATVSPANATNKRVVYISSNTDVATVNLSTGVITPVAAGTITITATASDGTLSSTYSLTVYNPVAAISSITRTGFPATIYTDSSGMSISATITTTNVVNSAVSYSSSATGVATVNSSTGAVAIVGIGSVILTATSVENPSVSSTTTFTVYNRVAAISAITRTGFPATVFENSTGLSISATITTSNVANSSVTYSSSNTTVATVNSSTGAITVRAAGTTILTATSVDNSSIFSTYTLTVSAIQVTGISSTTITGKVAPFYTTTTGFSARATVQPENATNKIINYSSSNVSIATINASTGAITPKSIGSTIITSTTADGNYTSTYTLIISSIQVTGISSTTITDNNIAPFYTTTTEISAKATVQPANATDKTINYSSSNVSVATINASTGAITPNSIGSTIITSTTADGNYTSTYTLIISQFSNITSDHTIYTEIGNEYDQIVFVSNSETSVQLYASIQPGTYQVSWGITNQQAGISISSSGLVTFPANVAFNAGIIQVFATDNNSNYRGIYITRGPPNEQYIIKTAGTVGYGAVIVNATSISAISFTGSTPVRTNSTGLSVSATVSPANSVNKGVTYTSSNTGVATVNSSTGVIAPVAAGTTTITATASDTTNGTLSSTYSLTVYNPVAAISAITRTGFPATVYTNSSGLSISASITTTNVADLSVTYSSSATSVATVNSSTGAITIVGTGSVTLTAASVENSGVFSTTSFTVYNPVAAISAITRTGFPATIYTDASGLSISATITTSNVNNSNVTYSSSATSVATVNSSTGAITIVGAGSVTLTAVSAENSGVSSTTTFTVYNRVAAISAISTTGFTAPVYTDASGLSISASITTTNVANPSVTYSSSATGVATVNSSTGAITLVGAGSVIFTATSAENAAVFSTVSLTVYNRVSSVNTPIFVGAFPLYVGETTDAISATVAPSTFVYNSTVSYSTSDATICDINATTGVMTPKKAGSVTLTATSTDGAKTSTYSLQVYDYVSGISALSYSGPTPLYVDSLSQSVSASVSPVTAYDTSITYTSSDITVLSVNSSTGALTPYKAGSVTITATTNDGSYTSTYSLTVYNRVAAMSDITTSGFPSTVYTNSTGLSISASITTTNVVNTTVNYSSSNTAVATINSSGTITITGAGTATLRVESAENSAVFKTYSLTVASLISVTGINTPTLSGGSVPVYVGATGLSVSASVLPVNATNTIVSYSSGTTSVATINSSTGAITIVAAGTVIITATSADGSFTSTYTLQVYNRPSAISALTGSWGAAAVYVSSTGLSVSASVTTSSVYNSAVSYSSSNTAVATVNSFTGAITVVAAGSTTFSAIPADNTNSVAASTLSLTVSSTVETTDLTEITANYPIYYADSYNTRLIYAPSTATSLQLGVATVPANALNQTFAWGFYNEGTHPNATINSSTGLIQFANTNFSRDLDPYVTQSGQFIKRVFINNSTTFNTARPTAQTFSIKSVTNDLATYGLINGAVSVGWNTTYAYTNTKYANKAYFRFTVPTATRVAVGFGSAANPNADTNLYLKNLKGFSIYPTGGVEAMFENAVGVGIGVNSYTSSTVFEGIWDATLGTIRLFVNGSLKATYNSTATSADEFNLYTTFGSTDGSIANITFSNNIPTDANYSGIVAVTSVATPTLSGGSAPVYVGTTGLSIAASVLPANATDKIVSYTSGTTSVATVNSSTGALTVVGAGSTTITATSADGSFTSTYSLTVYNRPAAISALTGSWGVSTVYTTSTGLSVSATVTTSSVYNSAVTYSSSNTAVATVDASGAVTVVGAGSTTLSVVPADNTGNVAASTLALTVSAPLPANSVTSMTDIVLESADPMHPNQWNNASVTLGPANAVDKSVTWTSSNPSILAIWDDDGVTQDVVIVAKGVGTATLRATSVSNTSIYKELSIRIYGRTTGMSAISYAGPATMRPTNTAILSATVFSSLTAYQGITWSSSNEALATIDASGVVTAVGQGTIVLSAKSVGIPVRTATYTLVVASPPVSVTGISQISYLGASPFRVGNVSSFVSASVEPANATTTTVVYTTDNSGVATVETNGRLSGISVGSCTITATTQDGGFLSTYPLDVAVAYIPVQSISSLTLTGATPLRVGDREKSINATVSGAAGATPTNSTVLYYSNTLATCHVNRTTGVLDFKGAGPFEVYAIASDNSTIRTAALTGTVLPTFITVTGITDISANNQTAVTLSNVRTVYIRNGQTLQLTAAPIPANATNSAITWSSSGAGITVDASGLATSAGINTDATITATNTAGTSKTIYLKHVVNVEGVQMISLTPDTPLELNTSAVATSGTFPNNATYPGVSWSISPAGIVSIDQSGNVTTLSPGSATIYATAIDNSGQVESYPITVSVPFTDISGISSVTYSGPKYLHVNEVGGKVSANVLPVNATNQAITWTWSPVNLISSIDASGYITPIANGVATIYARATSSTNTVYTMQKLVTIYPETVNITGIGCLEPDVILDVGDTVTMRNPLLPAYATNNQIIWTSSDPTIASVDASGNVLGITRGDVEIIATSVVNNAFVSSYNILVSAVPVSSVTPIGTSTSQYTIVATNTMQMIAQTLPANAGNKVINWTVSDASLATVDASGVLTATAPGAVVVRASADDDSAIYREVTVTIAPNPVTGITAITLPTGRTTIQVDETMTLTASAIPANATNTAVRWTSSHPSIVQVLDISNGIIRCNSISNFKVTITAATVDGTFRATYLLGTTLVAVSGMTDITTSSGSEIIQIGDTIQLSTEVLPINTAIRTYAWSYNAQTASALQLMQSAASINTTLGQVTGLATGFASFKATSSGTNINGQYVTKTITIQVGEPVQSMTPLTFSGSTVMVPGETKVLSTGLVPSSATQTGIFWYSSNTSIATVSNTGVVTVASRPTAKAFTITATPTPNNLNASGNVISVSQAFTITVAATSITAIAPNRTTIRIGETRNIYASVSPLNADNRTVIISITSATNASGQSVADPSTILSIGGDGFQITAVARGTATIRAASQSNPSLFSTLTMTIST